MIELGQESKRKLDVADHFVDINEMIELDGSRGGNWGGSSFFEGDKGEF